MYNYDPEYEKTCNSKIDVNRKSGLHPLPLGVKMLSIKVSIGHCPGAA